MSTDEKLLTTKLFYCPYVSCTLRVRHVHEITRARDKHRTVIKDTIVLIPRHRADIGLVERPIKEIL